MKIIIKIKFIKIIENMKKKTSKIAFFELLLMYIEDHHHPFALLKHITFCSYIYVSFLLLLKSNIKYLFKLLIGVSLPF